MRRAFQCSLHANPRSTLFIVQDPQPTEHPLIDMVTAHTRWVASRFLRRDLAPEPLHNAMAGGENMHRANTNAPATLCGIGASHGFCWRCVGGSARHVPSWKQMRFPGQVLLGEGRLREHNLNLCSILLPSSSSSLGCWAWCHRTRWGDSSTSCWSLRWWCASCGSFKGRASADCCRSGHTHA